MKQNGIVTKLLDRGRAEVRIERGTACGHACGGCETCVYASTLLVTAENDVFAHPGDMVVLEGRTKNVLGAALLVYMLPLAMFFAGYVIGAAFLLSQGLCVLTSLAGLALGVGFTVLLGRRRRDIVFRITGFQR